MTKTVSVKKAKEALQNLRKLAPANPKMDDDLEMSVKEAVFFMAPDLVQLTKRGLTHKEMSKGLSDDGIHIKAGTLNRYLNEYLVTKNDSEKSEAVLKTDDSKEEKPEVRIRPGAIKNPKPAGITAGEKSDSTTERLAGTLLSNQEGPRV